MISADCPRHKGQAETVHLEIDENYFRRSKARLGKRSSLTEEVVDEMISKLYSMTS